MSGMSAMAPPRPIGILGTGSYVPERVVTNEEVAAKVPDITADWIESRTGIRTRRYAADTEATSDLAAHAARNALDHAGLPATLIDYIIVSTSTGDFPQPATASILQQLIGAQSAACFDINAVCAGFVYAIEVARGLIMANPGSRALVVGADVYSRILNFSDRRTAVLLGDGAGAVIMGEVPEGHGMLDVTLSTHGEAQDLIKVAAGGSRLPTSAQTLADGGHFFTMQGRAVRDFVMNNVPPVVQKVLDRVGVGVDDIACFVPHQANGVLLGQLADRCGLSRDRTHLVVGRYGNLGSASVPVALDDAVRTGAIGDGELVLLSGFGGGMSVGTCLLRWSACHGQGQHE
ncbi:3-oxoacyl-ACP synthase III family protein [Streptomyces zagrosensis]|uniref:3-oxoacyl-[acyl-carrier-protein] synthase-3 n=1 Tax=Streptomyces zagrosensis TaxID=1042984 RepID=A0A7W9QDJ5_9ACTN|nr:beta-ketoacyl-ACP synthase III [Streptomyces zagrosensis]MBB5937242.1 3-oxoacyl-[acyl-carrier-protein] synthase-3 [Streptomyces zagrosensis]